MTAQNTMDQSSESAKFLEAEVFAVLLPGLEETLKVAKNTERRKRFNTLDYLVGYLYRNNPKHQDRDSVQFEEIPFVKEEWATKPRPPLPLSATLTEEQAAVIIQSHYRGYIARKTETATLFRSWQRGLWKERLAIKKIQSKWRKFSAINRAVKKPKKQETVPTLPTIAQSPTSPPATKKQHTYSCS